MSETARREFLKFLAASPYVAALGGVTAFLGDRASAQRSVAMIRVFRRLRLPTVQIIGLASFHLHLHRCMRDVEAPPENFDDCTKDLLAFPDALFGDDDVAAAGDHSRADHPHVKIVHVQDAGDAFNHGDDGRHIGACRRAFEERFSARRMTSDYLTVYRRLLSSAAPQRDGDQRRSYPVAAMDIRHRPRRMPSTPRLAGGAID